MNVLVVGESWTTYGVHIKGMTPYMTATYEESLTPLRHALEDAGMQLTHIPNHEVAQRLPRTVDGLSAYDVVALSDVSADTLLLHPDTLLRSQKTPNVVTVLREWVEGGGGLAMIGGYMSFSGFEGKARYYMTDLPEILPVELVPHDDRVERPEGVTPAVVDASHPALAGLPKEWPHFLGYNRLLRKQEGHVVLEVGSDPFLAVRDVGAGRTVAFASDFSPHWAPPAFLEWPFYGRFWTQLFRWLAGDAPADKDERKVAALTDA
jgi:uncharacterized membrane protein